MTLPPRSSSNPIWTLTKPKRNHMNRTRPLLSIIILLVIGGGLCIGLAVLVNTFTSYPAQAKELFGPPSPRLSSLQKYKLTYQLVRDQSILLSPTDPFGTEIEFPISQDESTSSILDRLKQANLIPGQDIVRDYLIYSGQDTLLQTGTFYLSPAMTPVEIVEAMLDSTPRYVTVAILPGWRIEQIAESIPTTGLEIHLGDFLIAAQNPEPGYILSFNIPPNATLEGFFFPGNYEIPRDATAEEVVSFIVDQFEGNIALDLREGFTRQGLDLYEAIILASIIEREAVVVEEMPIIASVFFNRLAIDMKLETDPTVQYAMGYNTVQGTWWTNPLSYADLEVISSYNTYVFPGLPPGPIANPSLAALQAVAFPAETPYFFFRATCDGSGRHNFSQTFEEHLGKACE